jgi:putative lipoprotein
MEPVVPVVWLSLAFGAPPDRPPDPWFGPDKAKHFVASALIQVGAHAALRSGGLDYQTASRGAGALTFVVGAGKELWDRDHGGHPSWRDLAADVAGGATGAVVVRQTRP